MPHRYDRIDDASLAVLVERFYARVRQDSVLGPVFEDAVRDWPAHLETLTEFWSSVMLTSGRYHGRPMQAHMRLPIRPEMFEIWLGLWRETASELFAPDPAELLIEKAERIAQSLSLGMFFRPDAVGRAEGRAPPKR